jgi:23S rRNA pseudouridine1911/1915/1917 synthase
MPLITITEAGAGGRLDAFLPNILKTSRAQIQKLIKAGEITLNNETVRTNTRLEVEDIIFYPEAEVFAPPVKSGSAPILDVIYQDDDLMVINKPAGLIVHQANERDTNPNVVDAILELHPSIAEVGDDPTRPGIVHRLDKEVSGLMVIAKTQEGFDHLKKQFKDHSIEKFYLALVYGDLPQDADSITLKIARSRARGRMVARTDAQEGKEARTDYHVLERLKETTYVRVQIHTGRTHQIRVHFFALGHSLVGDKLYKIKKMRVKPIALDRIFLHATKLSFKLLNGEMKTFELPLPPDLQTILTSLR